MFETVRTIIAILREKETAPHEDKIAVSLAELSTLWIRYNNSFEPVIPKGPPQLPAAERTIEVEPVKASVENSPVEPQTPKAVRAEPQRTDPASVECATSAFYDEVIEPYRDLLERDKALEGINAMVGILKEQGGCSSIVQQGYDAEREEVPRIEEILSGVSLRDHTLRTTRIAMQILCDRYGEKPVAYVPVMLIAALGHDLGKIPRFRGNGKYAKADHPVTSAAIVADLFPELIHTHTLGVALQAIREHHQVGKDQVALMLKEADGRARELEIAASDRTGAITPVAEWFDVVEYLERIGRQVNVTQTGNVWQAFSFDGTVYFDPEFLYASAQEMALEKNVINIELLRQSDRDIALLKVLKLLRPLNVLGDELGANHIARRYEVHTGQSRKRLSFTPFKASAFDDHGQFEARMKDHPPIVTGVRPL